MRCLKLKCQLLALLRDLEDEMAKFEADPLSVPASGPVWPIDGAPTWTEFLTAMKVGGFV